MKTTCIPCVVETKWVRDDEGIYWLQSNHGSVHARIRRVRKGYWSGFPITFCHPCWAPTLRELKRELEGAVIKRFKRKARFWLKEL